MQRRSHTNTHKPEENRDRGAYNRMGTSVLPAGMHVRCSVLVAMGIVVSYAASAGALEFSIVPNCVHPLDAAMGKSSAAGVSGIAINATAAEFYASFAGIFRLSDGSMIRAPMGERTESLRYMQELMYMIGVYVNESASRSPEGHAGDILQICGKVYAPRTAHARAHMHTCTLL